MIRYRRSLNHKLCRLGIGGCYFFIIYDSIGTLWRNHQVFGFRGEYGQNKTQSKKQKAFAAINSLFFFKEKKKLAPFIIHPWGWGGKEQHQQIAGKAFVIYL